MMSIAALVATLAFVDADWGSRHVTNRELLNEKRGRVVDAATGAGIPDATVIAMWDVSSQSIGGSSSGCVLQRITMTGANGDFLIPNVAPDLDLSERGTKGVLEPFTARVVDYSWRLVVFRPGYVREGDLHSFDYPDPARVAFAWESTPPSVSSALATVQITDIRMQRTEVNFRDTVLYYASIRHATSCPRTGTEQSAIHSIRAAFSQLVEHLPCSLPSDTPVDAIVAMEFSVLLSDDKFTERMKDEGQEKWPWTNTTAGALCRATGAQR
jgi:hypothetical protein